MITKFYLASRHFCTLSEVRLLLALVLFKISYFFLVVFILQFVGQFNYESYQSSYMHWPPTGGPDWTSHFVSCDGAQYLFLAENGYESGSTACAFYPLWPFLVRVFSVFTFGDLFISGMLLANLLSIWAAMMMYKVGLLFVDRNRALRAVAVLLSFPGAIFFNFIYTESLFLLLSLLLFLGLFKDNFTLIAICGFCLPLTKAIGAFAVIPIAYWYIQRRQPIRIPQTCSWPILGYGTYFLLMYLSTGNALEGFQAQKFYANQPSVRNIFNIEGFAGAFFAPLELHEMANSLIDRSFFVAFLVLLPFVWRLSPTLYLHSLCIGLIPALASWLVSYSRNLMMAFPLFIVLSWNPRAKWGKALWWVGLLMLWIIQIFLLVRYVNYSWAG